MSLRERATAAVASIAVVVVILVMLIGWPLPAPPMPHISWGEPRAPELLRGAAMDPGGEECLADGRHLAIEAQARGLIRQWTEWQAGQPVAPLQYRSGPARVEEAPNKEFLYLEMEYTAVFEVGEVPFRITGEIDTVTCQGWLVTLDGRSVRDWQRVFEERRQQASEQQRRAEEETKPRAEEALPTGEHCLDRSGRHLGFESLTREATEQVLHREGASRFTHSERPGTIRPAQEWHPYEADHHVIYENASGRIDTRDFYVKGAIHTETCEARLDSVR